MVSLVFFRGMGRNNPISADSKEDDCEALWHRGSQSVKRDFVWGGEVEAYSRSGTSIVVDDELPPVSPTEALRTIFVKNPA